MRQGTYRTAAWLLPAACLLLWGAGIARGADERSALIEEKRSLTGRVAALRQEQDYLEFQRAMMDVDSKYLVLDLGRKTGQLRYKNRVLKDFRFLEQKNVRGRVPVGKIAVTAKIEGRQNRHALLFGRSLVIRWKRSAVPEGDAGLPTVTLSRKELLSLYYAVEDGALAYVRP